MKNWYFLRVEFKAFQNSYLKKTITYLKKYLKINFRRKSVVLGFDVIFKESTWVESSIELC